MTSAGHLRISDDPRETAPSYSEACFSVLRVGEQRLGVFTNIYKHRRTVVGREIPEWLDGLVLVEESKRDSTGMTIQVRTFGVVAIENAAFATAVSMYEYGHAHHDDEPINISVDGNQTVARVRVDEALSLEDEDGARRSGTVDV